MRKLAVSCAHFPLPGLNETAHTIDALGGKPAAIQSQLGLDGPGVAKAIRRARHARLTI